MSKIDPWMKALFKQMVTAQQHSQPLTYAPAQYPDPFGSQPAPQPREPVEVELDTARIIIVALLGKLGGKVKFKSTDLMIEPGRFAVNKTHGDDGSIVLSLSPVRSDRVVEETE